MTKISFLISAMNEEKTIGVIMDNLARLKKVEPDIEVLAACDGSTDKTEEIINSYKFAKVLINGPRLGKNISIHRLTQAAKGDIIVIHDADWIFVWNKQTLKNMIDFFNNNPKIGGYVQGVPLFNKEKYMNDPARFLVKIGFIGEAVASNLVRSFMKKLHENKSFEKLGFTPLMFIIRGGIITKQTGIKEEEICDEAKRTQEMMKKNYAFIYSNETLPYFEVLYNRTSFHDLIKQRTRGFLSNKIQEKSYGWNMNSFYFGVFSYFFKEFFKLNLTEKTGLGVWILASLIAFINVKIGLTKDKRVWAHRGTRWDKEAI